MADVFSKRRVVSRKEDGTIFSPSEIAVDPETAILRLAIERKTSKRDNGYGDDCEIRLTIIVDDGVSEYRCETTDTGGIRISRGEEVEETVLVWALPTGFFGARSGFPKRLGEGKGKFSARVEIECLKGSFDASVELTSVIAPTEKIEFDEFQGRIRDSDGRSLR